MSSILFFWQWECDSIGREGEEGERDVEWDNWGSGGVQNRVL